METRSYRRVFCLVLDSLGVGELPDAAAYGDAGANTLAHLAEAVSGVALPNLERCGLGRLTNARGLGAIEPTGAYGRLAERSPAKDTTTGHWEMMGCPLDRAFATFPDGFPPEILEPFCRAIGAARVLGNEAASGTEIIERLGREHLATGLPIVYTSADSVFQIAAHVDVVPLEVLYRWCEVAREQLERHRVSRVIARPFRGRPGAFERTYDRRDFSLVPPAATVLDLLVNAGLPVIGVGKIEDIFAGVSVTRSIHTEGNRDGMAACCGLADEVAEGFVFANLVDFDMLYGHRRDPAGYARALVEFDQDLGVLMRHLRDDDLLVLTADHGNDPTHPGTDHTREYVPVLLWNPAGRVRGDLGTRPTFADLGATVAEALGVASTLPGASLLPLASAR